MVSEIRIFIEGGGDSKWGRLKLRLGFSAFFKEIVQEARAKRIRWHPPFACGTRQSAYDDFCTALKSYPKAFNILLVDSEAPVLNNLTPWKHLKARDKWENPGSKEENCHLMAQMMEAWLIADLDALKKFYGQGFSQNAIPKRKNVEEIDKDKLLTALNRATSKSKTKGKYHKINHAFDILASLNVDTVRNAAPHCNRLFKTLEEKIGVD